MQEEESCPRSSEGRAMTQGGSQSADEAPRAAWLWVRGVWGAAPRWGPGPPEITSTWSASPCTGRTTRSATTLTTSWTTRMRKYKWWNIFYKSEWERSVWGLCFSLRPSSGTTVERAECSATCLSVTVAVVRRPAPTSLPSQPPSTPPSTCPPPTLPTSSPRCCPLLTRSPWICLRPVLPSPVDPSPGRASPWKVRRLTEPCSRGSTSWWRPPWPASPALSWPESWAQPAQLLSSALYKWYLKFSSSETISLPFRYYNPNTHTHKHTHTHTMYSGGFKP